MLLILQVIQELQIVFLFGNKLLARQMSVIVHWMLVTLTQGFLLMNANLAPE